MHDQTIHAEDKTTPRVRGVPREVDIAARRLRREMTFAERVLWHHLRRRQVNGLYFRRQYAVGPFVLDFCCPARKLAIEVDGPIHDRRVEHDEARTQQLNAFGYQVLRFRNEEVVRCPRAVVQEILEAASSRLALEPGD